MTAPAALGLVTTRPPGLLGPEPFLTELVSAMEERLRPTGLSVLLHAVATGAEESAAYRRWAAEGLVDAVVLLDLAVDDARPRLLGALGLPVVVVGEWDGVPSSQVLVDEAGPVHAVVARLVELGHRRVARVTGPASLVRTRRRTEAMLDACAAAGLEPVVVASEGTEASAAERTHDLLRSPEPPTAVVYDSDVMALGGLRAADELRVVVPDRLSVVAWDDSVTCRLARPALTAVSVDVHAYGAAVADAVLHVLAGGAPVGLRAPGPVLVERASTGPPA